MRTEVDVGGHLVSSGSVAADSSQIVAYAQLAIMGLGRLGQRRVSGYKQTGLVGVTGGE